MKSTIKIALIFCVGLPLVAARTPWYVTAPYDMILDQPWHEEQRLHVFANAETLLQSKGYNTSHDHVNVLKLWSVDQDALAMLRGFDVDSEINILAQTLQAANDDGVRGHFNVTGEIKMPLSASVNAVYKLSRYWRLGLYIPFSSVKLTHTQWTDLTQSVTPEDLLTKELLTDNFFSNVYSLGSGLELGNWSRTGFGDITLMARWDREFLQHKEFLKWVYLYVHLGVSLPTGRRADEDTIFPIALGNNGAFGIPFQTGIVTRFKNKMAVGVYADFLYKAGSSQTERVKVDAAQTELLLLEKTRVARTYGIQQKFFLFVEPIVHKGFTIRLGYEYVKQGHDKIVVQTNDVSGIAPGTAVSLLPWTSHAMILQGSWDVAGYTDFQKNAPFLSVYGRMPFNGTRSVGMGTLGFELSLSF